MSNELYGRKIEFFAGSKQFIGEDFTIYFDVPFDDAEDANVATVNVYNLAEATINEFKQGQKIVLNAGYEGDVGAVLLGEAKGIKTEWDGVDKITKIEVLDGSEKWLNTPIQKTYKAGIKGKQILNDILAIAGLEIGVFNLPVNKVYQGGKTIKSKLSTAIASIAKDCGAKVHVNRNKIFIRPKNEGNKMGFVLDAEHGLIASPTPIKKEVETGEKDATGAAKKKTINGWKVVCLLNHRITTDALIQVKSKTANGIFRVESGKHSHNGDDFYTEMEVYPQ